MSAFVGRWQAEVWREFDAAERAKGRAARTIEKGKRRRSRSRRLAAASKKIVEEEEEPEVVVVE